MAEPEPSNEPSSAAPKAKRAKGRPRREDAPLVPWEHIDRLLVFGQPLTNTETGEESIKYPTLRELGERYGISRNLVWQYSRKARCLQRREEAVLRTQERYAQQVVERVATARALATVDVVAVVDSYVAGFKQALDEGKVRFDSPSDLDRMVRLKELLVGNADARQDLRAGVTLEAIQQRHQRVRAQLVGHTPELTGTAPEAGEKEEAHAQPVVDTPELAGTTPDAGEKEEAHGAVG